MTEPWAESRNRRTTVAVDWGTLERLGALQRAVQASENRTMNLGEVIEWALDRLDVLDVP